MTEVDADYSRVIIIYTRPGTRKRQREQARRAKQKSHKLQARVIECGVGIPARD